MNLKVLCFFVLVGMVCSFNIVAPFKTKNNAPSYSIERSKFLADLSAIAYCKSKAIEDWSCALCKKHPTFIEITHIENYLYSIVGFVGYNNDTQEITLTWRGSIDIQNYFEDVNF